MLQSLVIELLFDVHAVGHWTLWLLAVLGVVTAKGNELLADGTGRVPIRGTSLHGSILALAGLGVLHNPLHLDARWTTAVGISTLTGVVERLDAPLNGQAT